MKRLFLVHGDPGSGKTPLARALRDEHAFEYLSLDALYVEFIKAKCPTLYFDDLKKFIAPHYQCILQPREYSYYHFKRDLVNEWHEYMLTATLNRSAHHNNLVAEGFLLYDCLSDLEARMSQIARVFLVHASNGTYQVLGASLTVKQIATLGQEEQTREKQGGDMSA